MDAVLFVAVGQFAQLPGAPGQPFGERFWQRLGDGLLVQDFGLGEETGDVVVAAANFTDACNLTADWLQNGISSHPGDQPNSGRTASAAPLVATLAACNRGGYLTGAWQAAADPHTDARGNRWQTKAAVEGTLKDPVLLGRLIGEAGDAGLAVLVTDSNYEEAGVPVVLLNDGPRTRYGAFRTPRDVRVTWSVIKEAALSDIITATTVTLTTKEWGSEAGHCLWQFLDSFFGNTNHPYTPAPSNVQSRFARRGTRHLPGQR